MIGKKVETVIVYEERSETPRQDDQSAIVAVTALKITDPRSNGGADWSVILLSAAWRCDDESEVIPPRVTGGVAPLYESQIVRQAQQALGEYYERVVDEIYAQKISAKNDEMELPF